MFIISISIKTRFHSESCFKLFFFEIIGVKILFESMKSMKITFENESRKNFEQIDVRRFLFSF